MQSMSIDAMKQALEALKSCSGVPHWPALQPSITAIRAAIEQAEKQEPRQWVGLTEEEIFKVENAVPDEVIGDSNWCVYFANAIEAKLKEKNT
jgi:hypothetical protein